MFKILEKQIFSPIIKLIVVEAPKVALKCQPGQFIILRIHEEGERVPFFIADFNRQKGTVTIVFKEVGKTTRQLGAMEVDEYIKDIVGPLGTPSHIERFGTVVCVGGDVGIAPIYPIARTLKEAGNHVIGIMGSRNKEFLFWEDKMRLACNELFITTDDGSYVREGFVTDVLKEVIETAGKDKIDMVLVIGPQPMMRDCCHLTKGYGIKTIVSLNSLMLDGIGMCGSCRVTVGGKTKFVCINGPEFDGHLVDFKELALRSAFFNAEEKSSLDILSIKCGCGSVHKQ